MSRSCTAAFGVLGSFLLLVGCEGGGLGSPPQSVGGRAKAAMNRGDWKAWAECFTPESQGIMAFLYVENATQFKNMEGLAEIGGPRAVREVREQVEPILAVLARHGVDEAALDSIPGSPQDQRKAAIRQVASRVTDRTSLVADMMQACKELEKKTGHAPMPTNWHTDARVVDVQIHGDQASGNTVQTVEGRGMKFPVYFRRVGGRWRIDLVPMFPDLM